MALDMVRVPAAEMLHQFQPLAAGQLRGLTWLAPILLRLHELDQYDDAALVKAKVAALFTGFIHDPDGTVAGLNDGTAANGILNVGMEPGSLILLRPAPMSSFRSGRPRRLWRLRQEPDPLHRLRTRRSLRARVQRPRRRDLFLDPHRPRRVSSADRAPPIRRDRLTVLPLGVGALRAARHAFRRDRSARLRSRSSLLPSGRVVAAEMGLGRSAQGCLRRDRANPRRRQEPQPIDRRARLRHRLPPTAPASSTSGFPSTAPVRNRRRRRPMPDLFVRRAALAPQTADAEARTIEAV